MSSGIYQIVHVSSGKRYIGQSKNVHHRLRNHRKLLSNNRHHNRALKRAWDKYGSEGFVFEVLLLCSPEHLSMYEELCIRAFSSNERERGYNFRKVSDSNRGLCVNAKHKVGDREGMLVLSAIVGKNKHGQNIGVFTCDCGNTKRTLVQEVLGGIRSSCGCQGRLKFVALGGVMVTCREAAKRLGVSLSAISNRVHRKKETHQEACDHYAANKPPSVIVHGKKLSIIKFAHKYGVHRTSVTYRVGKFGETHQQSCDHFARRSGLKIITNCKSTLVRTLQRIAA